MVANDTASPAGILSGAATEGPKIAEKQADMTGSIDTYCRAPFVSLYLDQFGNAKACCQHYPSAALGNIKHDRLGSIWNGPRARELRQAVKQGDLSRGCGFCNWERTNEVEPGFPANFQFADAQEDPSYPVQLELSLSSACNLQCVMCNGYFSSSIRIHREQRPPLPDVYPERFYEDLKEFAVHLQRVAVFGGEPFLAGPSLRALEVIASVNPTVQVSITTNATVWNERVESLVDTLDPEIVVSLDAATAPTFEQIRVGANFGQVMTNLDRFRTRCSNVSIAHCLMTNNWHEFDDLLRLASGRALFVGVNTVLRPTELSLFHLPQTELRDISAAMERQNPTDLGENQAVWDDQLAAIHRAARWGWEGQTNSPWSETTVQLQTKPTPTSLSLTRRHEGWLPTKPQPEDEARPLNSWISSWVGQPDPQSIDVRRSEQFLDTWLMSLEGSQGFIATFSNDGATCELSMVRPMVQHEDSRWLESSVPVAELDGPLTQRVMAGLTSEGAERLAVVNRAVDGLITSTEGDVDLLGEPVDDMVGTHPVSLGELVGICGFEPGGTPDLRELKVTLAHAPTEVLRLIELPSAWILATVAAEGRQRQPSA